LQRLRANDDLASYCSISIISCCCCDSLRASCTKCRANIIAGHSFYCYLGTNKLRVSLGAAEEIIGILEVEKHALLPAHCSEARNPDSAPHLGTCSDHFMGRAALTSRFGPVSLGGDIVMRPCDFERYMKTNCGANDTHRLTCFSSRSQGLCLPAISRHCLP
jgi:hypothetical protein